MKMLAMETNKKQAWSQYTIHISARIATNEEGLAEARQQKAVREEKVQKENTNREKRLDEEARVQMQRQQVGRTGMSFTATLTSQKLQGLCDIA